MESESHQHDATLYQAWAWFETHKKEVTYGIAAAMGIGLVIYFISWNNQQKQDAASEAFSKAFTAQLFGGTADIAALKSVTTEYSGSKAAERAELLLGTDLFVQGKYADAQTAFQKFLRDNAGSPLSSQALLGVAACLDAQGKTNEAITAYDDLRSRHATENVAPQAKFALARLYQGQNKLKEALQLYEDLATSSPGSSIGSEAGGLAEDIKAKHPDLIPPRIMPTNLPTMGAQPILSKPAAPSAPPAAGTNAPKP